jgi:hypothetical protein
MIWPRRVRQVLLGAHDVRDRHRRVVDDARVVVGREAVGAQDHEVADLVAGERDVAAHVVA